jgi:outer membrane murein-binding lipoprotein Lpp
LEQIPGFLRISSNSNTWKRWIRHEAAMTRLSQFPSCVEMGASMRIRQAPKRKERTMSSARKTFATAAMVILGGMSLSACVTTDYVDERIAAVNARIDALEARVQENTAAAQAAGAQAQSANQRVDQLTTRVDSLEQRMAARAPRN